MNNASTSISLYNHICTCIDLMPLSPHELRTLEVTNVVVSFISLTGSLFVIFCFLKFKDLRTFAFKLVFMIATADLIFELGNSLGDAGGNPETHLGASPVLCVIQGYVLQDAVKNTNCFDLIEDH